MIGTLVTAMIVISLVYQLVLRLSEVVRAIRAEVATHGRPTHLMNGD
jgi:hypothetical protein